MNHAKTVQIMDLLEKAKEVVRGDVHAQIAPQDTIYGIYKIGYQPTFDGYYIINTTNKLHLLKSGEWTMNYDGSFWSNSQDALTHLINHLSTQVNRWVDHVEEATKQAHTPWRRYKLGDSNKIATNKIPVIKVYRGLTYAGLRFSKECADNNSFAFTDPDIAQLFAYRCWKEGIIANPADYSAI